MSNRKPYLEEIICARSTPPGSSAVAVIRASGKGAYQLLSEIFTPVGGKTKSFVSHKAYYGKIYDEERLIDDVLVIPFKDGKSFSGEESFEINCHGSDVIVSILLKLLCSHGARLAEPGEFSKRAFFNGKIDLSEAEAIMDLVNASTKQAALIAVQQLTGRVRNEIDILKDKLADILSAVEVYIDYPEEDLSFDIDRWLHEVRELQEENACLIEGFSRGKFYRTGINMTLLGRTNVGKSTLFNYMLNEDKAIVSDVHGTTRDYLDGMIHIEGYGVRVFDTAGLRKTEDRIEQEGTKRSLDLSEKADLVVYILSADSGMTQMDRENLISIHSEKKVICVLNKWDLMESKGADSQVKEVEMFLAGRFSKFRLVKMSALYKTGFEEFSRAFVELLTELSFTENVDPVITNERHAQLLEEATQFLSNGVIRLQEQVLDLAAFELRAALDKYGEITGEVTSDDILNRIFSTFCVGK